MKKILIIENDPQIQKIYQEKLAQEGFEATGAYTGQEGLSIAISVTPDLILLDIMLPGGLNGFDVLERLKENENLNKVPVIILTSLSGEEKTAKKIGAKDYIVKTDILLDDLVEKINKHLK